MQRLSNFTMMVLLSLTIMAVIMIQACTTDTPSSMPEKSPVPKNAFEAVGERAGVEALRMLAVSPTDRVQAGSLIALSNAGYVEINGLSTFAAQEGLARVTQSRRGYNELVEVHSTYDAPLWFAVYDKASGKCAYLELHPAIDPVNQPVGTLDPEALFHIRSVETIRAVDLYENVEAFDKKMESRPFGDNAFRIITMANAVEAGAPTSMVKSFEFHDHYCPGVTSGILMANYIKKNFPLSERGAYFVQSVQPWCKEDALVVMLNTTPGKRGYAVSYPSDEDKAEWKETVKDAATIIYRRNPDTDIWDGIILGFNWGKKNDCPDFGKSMLGKLCSDLYLLKHLKDPDQFVKAVHTFQLPKGVHPKAYARPGVNPMAALGLTSN